MILAVSAVALAAGLIFALWTAPRVIRASAEALAGGRPWCLALPRAHRPVSSRFDLTLFRARGGALVPHMVLWIEGQEPLHRSYRAGSFQSGPPTESLQHCLPRADYLNTMTPGPDGFYVVTPQGVFRLPPETTPSHVGTTLYLRLGLVPDRHASDSIAPDPGEVGRFKTNPGKTILERRFASGCEMRFTDDLAVFKIRVPCGDPADLRDQVLRIWAGYRLPDPA